MESEAILVLQLDMTTEQQFEVKPFGWFISKFARVDVDENAKIPGVDAPIEERLLFLQENMVNFVKQYNLPVIEVSLVVSKYIRVL